MQRTLGRMEGTLNSHVQAFDRHLEQDMEAYKAISVLKTEHARQKGFFKAVTLGWAAVTAVLASVASFFVHRWLGTH